MKPLKELLLASAAPYRRAFLRRQLILEAIASATDIKLQPRSLTITRRGIRVETSAVRRSEIFSKQKLIKEIYERSSKEQFPGFY